MRHGFLLIETRADRPGLVRVYGTETESEPAPVFPQRDDRPKLRYCAHFQDLDAALMHTHEPLRRRLVDIDKGLYRADPLEAVASAQSVDLRHWQTYVDAEIADDPRLANIVTSRRRRKKRFQLLWNIVGAIAILLLLLKPLLGL